MIARFRRWLEAERKMKAEVELWCDETTAMTDRDFWRAVLNWERR